MLWLGETPNEWKAYCEDCDYKSYLKKNIRKNTLALLLVAEFNTFGIVRQIFTTGTDGTVNVEYAMVTLIR